MSESLQLGVVLTSQGSKYAVTGARTNSRSEVDTVLTELKSDTNRQIIRTLFALCK